MGALYDSVILRPPPVRVLATTSSVWRHTQAALYETELE